MTEIGKLRVLLPHWIEHNRDHALEFERWADTAEEAEYETAADLIRQAIQRVQQANEDLEKALDELGGPVSLETHDHTH
jgi:exonuclease VII small subunit